MIRIGSMIPSPCPLAKDLPFVAFRWLMKPLLLLSTLGFVLLLIASSLDLDLTLLWYGRGPELWTKFMSRSIFEGHSFGASDLPNLLFIGSLLLYTLGASRLRQKAPHWLAKLGFINLAGLWISSVVHIIKGASQRPRPYQTLEQGLPYINFYELSSWTFQGWGHGSFPSGHTASMMSLLVFAYILPQKSHRNIAALFALIAALSMAAARIVVGAHWLTDTLAAIILVGLCCHLLYRYILRVPDQLQWLAEGQAYPQSLTFWELKLLPRLVLGLFIPLLPVLIGTRYQDPLWLGVSSVLSLVLFYFFIKDLGNFQLQQLQKLRGSTLK